MPLAAFVLLLSGCSRNKVPDWLVGEWTFDVEATMESVGLGLYMVMVPMLNDMEMIISQDNLIISFQGRRTLSEIEIEQREANKITIKLSDGELRDFNKSQNGFWTLADNGQLKMFFKRKHSLSGSG